MRGAATRVVWFQPAQRECLLHLRWRVVEKCFKLRRAKALRLRRLVIVVELNALADQHLHRVAGVRRVVPLKFEADRAVTA